MFNKLNKRLSNKQLLELMSHRMRCLNTRNTANTTESPEKDPSKSDSNDNNDYFGIFDVNNKEISGLYEKNGQQNNVCDKYKDLLDSRQSKMNDQNYLTTTFGRVRLDSDNNPKFHGQYDPNNTRLKFNANQFEEKLINSRKIVEQNEDINQNEAEESTNDTNLFEEQYFDQIRDNEIKETNLTTDINSSNHTKDPISSGFGFIDKQYFKSNIKPLFKSKINFKFNQEFNQFLEEKSSELKTFDVFGRTKVVELKPDQINDNMENNSHLLDIEFKSPLKSELFSQNIDLNVGPNEELTENFEKEIQKKIDEQMDIKLETIESTANLFKKTRRTGAQYLADIQSGKDIPKHNKLFTQKVVDFRTNLSLKREKLDSKGFRILSGQVIDYSKLTREDIADLLINSILFNDCDIVAINKPYGMSIHTKESNMCPVLTEYLPQLSANVETEKLYTVHRLDKDTTGVLLMAKSQEKAKQLNRMFAEHSIIKRYLCITRGVPDQLQGIIDIPIEIGKVGERERMVLRPESLEEYKSITRPSKSAKRAVTQYQVVSHFDNSALIEIWPQTGVRHQIRVHLGFGLRCPILGDHKYSHLDRIAPQKLTGDMLLALNVRQAKVRHIPLHLHAMQYCLPNAGSDGRNIFINAPLPHHINKNMSRLGLRQ